VLAEILNVVQVFTHPMLLLFVIVVYCFVQRQQAENGKKPGKPRNT